jgi:hypothetical protein
MAGVVAVASAQPFAGGWNDGSRLAAVESLVDHGTHAIDASIFLLPYPDSPFAPYAANDLRTTGTQDKLIIDGHFYSDKPPVVSVVMAKIYFGLRCFGLPKAADRPDWFCWWMTLATSGMAFVVAVWAMFSIGLELGLAAKAAFAWVSVFAIATVAPTYAWHVNNHILLLAVVAVLLLELLRIGNQRDSIGVTNLRLMWIGTLAGLAYNLDLAAGPVLVLGLLVVVLWRMRNEWAVGAVVAGMLPWIVAHHSLNYALGGVWQPMNAIPQYLAWPGSPFSEQNLTGIWRHSPLKFVVYALAMLFGKHGFIGHNVPLYLAVAAIPLVLRHRVKEHAEVCFGIGWCAATWILYAAYSNNYGGACCSIRWFVPFLAPLFFALAILLREHPKYWADFAILGAWGGVLGIIMWCHGPWTRKMVPFFWPIQAAALVSWAAYRIHRLRFGAAPQPIAVVVENRAA